MSDDARSSGTRSHRSAGRVSRSRIIGLLVTVVRVVGIVAAVLLVAHVVLTVGRANPTNGITMFVAGWADTLAFGFRDLFQPADPRAAVLVNYGLAAVVWLVVTAVVARLLRRLG